MLTLFSVFIEEKLCGYAGKTHKTKEEKKLARYTKEVPEVSE